MKVTILLFVLQISAVLAQEQQCGDDHEYYDDNDGKCHTCPTCPPGSEPTRLCGFGRKHRDHSCQPCKAGFYSASHDYALCKACEPCSHWNARTERACSTHSDAVCGTCLPGFFTIRDILSGGSVVDVCVKCDNTSTSDECVERPTPSTATVVTSTFGLFCLALLSTGAVLVYLRLRRTRCRLDVESSGKRGRGIVMRQGIFDKLVRCITTETSVTTSDSTVSYTAPMTSFPLKDRNHRFQVERLVEVEGPVLVDHGEYGQDGWADQPVSGASTADFYANNLTMELDDDVFEGVAADVGVAAEEGLHYSNMSTIQLLDESRRHVTNNVALTGVERFPLVEVFDTDSSDTKPCVTYTSERYPVQVTDEHSGFSTWDLSRE